MSTLRRHTFDVVLTARVQIEVTTTDDDAQLALTRATTDTINLARQAVASRINYGYDTNKAREVDIRVEPHRTDVRRQEFVEERA